MRTLVQRSMDMTMSKNENVVMENLYFHRKLYDHPNRWERLISMEEFQGPAPTHIPVGGISTPPPIMRVDGTVPSWVEKGL